MSVTDQPKSTSSFKDRSNGLMAFGVIQVLMGLFCAMLVPLMLLASVAPGAPNSMRAMIPAVGIYGTLAAVLIWLGIGSILARRWARALTLVLAWMALVTGIVSMVVICFWMPDLSAAAPPGQQIPPQMIVVMQVTMLATMGCMYLVIPGVFVAFYRSPHVKATCEFRDPMVRWTDKCPLPVLALSLMLGFGAVSILFCLGYGPVMPFFGFILTGVPGILLVLALALLFGYLARAIYQLKMGAWWATLVMYGIFGVSRVITFSRVNMLTFYRKMDIPEDQLATIERMGMFEGMKMPLMMTGLSCAVFVAYILWVRRYFVAATTRQTDS